MATTNTPTNQILHNTPYSQTLLHENTVDSKVYISRRVNQLLKAIGNDLVLKGLELVQDPVINGLTVSFTLSTGLIIQDSTLIEINEQVTLDINVSPYDSTEGYLIIYTEFQHMDSINENPIKLKLSYVKADGTALVGTNSWNSSINRIILYRFSFVKTTNALVSVTQEESNFTLIGKEYNLKGHEDFTNYAFRIINDHASLTTNYGLATEEKYGHVKVPSTSNLVVQTGSVSVPESTTVTNGVVKLATEDEAILMESKTKVLTPDTLKHIILNLKDIDIQVVDPGVTLGTALILS
jgi:hypothetical protein